MVKLNDNFSCRVNEPADDVLLSLCTNLSSEELAQVSLTIKDSKLQVVAPAAIAAKIGQMIGLCGE